MADEILLFVYGSLKKGFPANPLLRLQRYLGVAWTAPRYILFNLGQFPGLVEGSQSIWGELYEIDSTTLMQINEFEGVHSLVYELRSIDLDGFSLVNLPMSRKVFNAIQAKQAQTYFYLRNLESSAEAGSFWSLKE